ncbi:bifunctional acetaldehyde-CoA/alcohol dehydrogenase [Sediminispirochaeta bajacaliforniensis]|uniref:bifunctional acetaldehyde-CoA/alcohol dehydrogenase n=1 Tax=Sediminispirochaeta bajacaliforniensis TaxID=148 RepID=UPI000368D10E|nr:bifunctional acetaldehyde-CoA/alcohol dehydrogenase [Sediminispirochaeta bajacaliforniensis]
MSIESKLKREPHKAQPIGGEAMLNDSIRKVAAAQARYARYNQQQVDAIFRAAAMAAAGARIELAKLAAKETGMGVTEDKVIKNHFASEYIYNKYKDMKSCGIIEEDLTFGVTKIAEPLGVIAGVVPTTNPTSTTIFKALLALKTRNGIIFSPHPRAKVCTIEAARIVLEAAVAAGAPKDIVGWIEEPSVELSRQLMEHPSISLILATGGPGMVKAAYSSGTPAIGVGAGNTPALIDESADVKMAVSSILMSKTFDNGMICASEQSVVVVEKIYREVKSELVCRGAYILDKEEKEKLGRLMFGEGKLSPKVVGQKASTIAGMAGFTVPESTKVLVAEVEAVGSKEPLSAEKLSPVLALYKKKEFSQALETAAALVTFGGLGHTSVLYTNPANRERIERFGATMKTGRTLVNMPASQGAIGDIYNFSLEPSLTLGCGSWGGNSVSKNVGPEQLLNYKTIAARRENMLWFRAPKKVFFKRGSLPVALEELEGKKKAFIVTDRFLFDSGMTKVLTDRLERMGIKTEIFSEVQADPTLSNARTGVRRMDAFQPDLIIAFGGGSPMDAAKIMWVLYEHPEVHFQDLAARFMDIRKRVYRFPEMGQKASLIAIPTTSGTGSEVTPFAVITDDETGIKYPIADYALTPDMAICDAELAAQMPARLTAYSGIDAVTHGLEAIASMLATEYTTPLAMESIRLLFEYLPRAYRFGAADMEAREKVHHASNMAGMAFANAFLGVCHSMAHKLGSFFHLPHGLANALLINQVVRFNASEAPAKQGTFPQYTHPQAAERYARLADYLGLGGGTMEEKVDKLLDAITKLKAELDIPKSIAEAGIKEEAFTKELDAMAEAAFDDQCTGANPRYPLINEIKDLYMAAFAGKSVTTAYITEA